MAERKATNKYYPPDWDPSKGSINAYHGVHPLRDRARKLDAGILIIRFEMPFNIWCLGCSNPIGTGVRFNAEKRSIGKYLSTTRYAFRMKCPTCKHWIEIQTDPQNARYLVTEGARRKEERYSAESAETFHRKSEEEAEKLVTNPMFSLEHRVNDQRRANLIQPTLERLQALQDLHHQDNYASSRSVRAMFRHEKRLREAHLEKEKDLAKKLKLAVPLVPEVKEDVELAQSVHFERQAPPKASLAQTYRRLQRKTSRKR